MSRYTLWAILTILCVGVAHVACAGGIDIKYERQNTFNNGRQKFVVIVTNSTELLFKGNVSVTAVDPIDNSVDRDTIPLYDGLPPGGAKKFAILWFKEPMRIAELKFKVTGNYFDAAPATTDVPYEEVGSQAGLNYMSIFVYTPKKDRASLQKIVNIYKARYASLNGFQILFFSDRKKAARSIPMSDAAVSVMFGSYHRNRSSGLDELTLD